jgi:periplasmic divalent cation tolerance protein
VNLIGGARSHFRWKGETCVDAEAVLIAKTRADLMGRVTKIIEANHPYELPEVIFLPVLGGSKGYLDWVKGETVQESP